MSDIGQDTLEEEEEEVEKWEPKMKAQYSAKQFFSHQKANVRVAVYEQLPAYWDALEEKPPNCRKAKDLMNLNLDEFMAIVNAFGKAYGMSGGLIDDFLG